MVNKGKANTWKRKHTSWRWSMFTPFKVSKGPKSSDKIGKYRITQGVDVNGKEFTIVDKWREVEDPHKCLATKWRGTTTFVPEA